MPTIDQAAGEAASSDAPPVETAASLSPDGVHIHMSVADGSGRVWGGHMQRGCIVRTTAELLVALLPGWRFGRERDPATGYLELSARRK